MFGKSSFLVAVVIILMGLPAMSMEVTVNKSEIKDSTFDVEIPIAGRYRVEVSAKGEATLFIEDYIYNVDDRTYDITAAMLVKSADQFVVVQKDGSPLNTGVHNMRVNFISGAATIRWIRFILLKEHELTPYILKQNLEGDEWTLVWSDEFEEDGAPDAHLERLDLRAQVDPRERVGLPLRGGPEHRLLASTRQLAAATSR